MKRATRTLIVFASAAASLALTYGAWRAAREQSEREDRLRFDLRVEDIANSLRGRMLDYEQVLRGAVALFAASQSVEREEWTAYVRRLETPTIYPGIQALGYGRAQRQGRELRVPLTYIEPLDALNEHLVGLDMYAADPGRRIAMDRARDAAEPVLTGQVQLLQDRGGEPRPGVVLFLPVFRNGAPPARLEARRAELDGFVYGAFRVGDLLERTVGDTPGIRLRLTDVSDPGAPAVLYAADAALGAAARFSNAQPIAVRGRTWRLEADALPWFGAASDRPRLVAAGGIAVSMLFAVLVWSLLNTTTHARDLARRMSAALRESERRLALALGSSGLALFDWDLRTGVVHLGAEWGEILGGAPEPSVTPIDRLQALVHPDDLPALREQLRRLLKGEIGRYRLEHRVRNMNGDWIWIESVAEVSERDASGRALRVTGTNGDVTERKKVAEMKNVFVAAVSHELRTPLTGLIASLELLREGAAGELAPQARDFVLRAHANGERLSSLINDVLDLERAESGRLRLSLERLDASRVVREAAELDSAYAERFKVRLAVDAAPGLALTADQRRVLQVLSNLISNAAKFSPPGSEIRLAARAEGDRVVLSVSDQGPGIPEDFKPRLFGRFEQASHGKGGTGLGLAICKVLVERMGGRIWCESAPGQGTAFRFELPRAS